MSLALYLIEHFKKEFNLETWSFLMKRVEKAKSWDHIDELSANITGEIFLHNPNLQSEIKALSISRNPWMRRLSIVSQYPSIRKGKIQLCFLLAEKLVYDDNIYVQKGAGWMLRECGKKNQVAIQEFIKIHRKMKPVAFSYATEKMLSFRKFIKEMLEKEKDEAEKSEVVFENKDSGLSPELEKIKYFKG
jgi:3-methyladenine DNA glycosylase AlkD